LLAAVQTHGTPRDHAIVITLLHTGLRNDELCGLKREHLQLGKRGGHIRIYGKRNKYREVPLNATVRAELKSYLKTLPADVPYLFPSQKGELVDDAQPEGMDPQTSVSGSSAGAPVRRPAPIQQRALGYLIAKYAKLAKVVDLSPHDLRHRFGYRMARTVPLHRLAQIMGHDSLDTTMVYVRGTPQDLQQAVEAIAWA
jgi:integrase/recombinase XerC